MSHWQGIELQLARNRVAELEALVESGLRFAETCEWDKLEPAGFRARAEVWIADARFALSQRTKP